MSQPTSPPTKIMIIRHAEKPPTNPPPNGIDVNGAVKPDSLIVRGWQRAGALAVLFAPYRGPLQSPGIATPQFIYASSTSAAEGNRPEETVRPLIDRLTTPAGLLVTNFDFAKDAITGPSGIVASVLSCDGVVLISWPHGQIPTLAEHIPPSPNHINLIPTTWPSDRFDVIWIFDKDVTISGVGYTFSQVPQLLLAGDDFQVIEATTDPPSGPIAS
jgi:hypothetical protein